MDRFTAYLSEREREALRSRAKALGASENYLVRIALRQFFEQLDDPDIAEHLFTRMRGLV